MDGDYRRSPAFRPMRSWFSPESLVLDKALCLCRCSIFRRDIKIVARFSSVMLGLSAGTALAQYTYTPPVYSPLAAISSDVRYQGVVSSLNAIVNETNQGEKPDVEPVRLSSVSYRYDRARTKQNLRNFAARTPDPAARANLEQMFASEPTLMDEISAAARRAGFDPHNVADAFAIWWVNSWLIANRRGETPDPETITMVKNQAVSAFVDTLRFAETSDAERQEYAEALLLQATLMDVAFDQWKDDPRMLDQLAEAVQRGARTSGLDLTTMVLTRDGFVPRKGR
jgi:hypothetical protein